MNFDPYHLSLVVAVVVVAVCAACLGQAGSPVEPGKPFAYFSVHFNNYNKGYSLSKNVFWSIGRSEYHVVPRRVKNNNPAPKIKQNNRADQDGHDR